MMLAARGEGAAAAGEGEVVRKLELAGGVEMLPCGVAAEGAEAVNELLGRG